MQKWLASCAVLMLCVSFGSKAQSNLDERCKQYIEQYKQLAIEEQLRSGIPAAITLAQGIHETQAGASELATNANNHFGIKCKSNWTGERYTHTDDAPDECFRKYAKAEDSYKDHSDFLSKNPRYAPCMQLSVTDYAAWAFALKRCGYATNPAYPQVLIKCVEDYHLQQYTYAAMSSMPSEVVPETDAQSIDAIAKEPEIKTQEDNPNGIVSPGITTPPVVAATVPEVATTPVPATIATTTPEIKAATPEVATEPLPVAGNRRSFPPYGQLVTINGLKAVYAKKGDMLLEYAYKHNVRYARLLEINELEEKPLPADMFIYLERKNFKGTHPTHVVEEGETTQMIAQAEGVQVKFLRALNYLKPGEEPATGATIELQKQAKKRPALVMAETTHPTETPKPSTETTSQPAITVATVNTDAAVKTPDAVATETTAPQQEVPKPQTENTVAKGDMAPAVDTVVKEMVVQNEAATEVKTETQQPDNQPQQTPDSTVSIAKTEERPDAVVTETPKEVEVPKPEPAKPEEPKSELDMLKAKFDKSVYSGTKPKTQAAQPVAKTEPAQPATTVPTEKKEVKIEYVTETPRPKSPKKMIDEANLNPPAKTVSTTQTPPQKQEEPVVASGNVQYHVVKKGETAFGIAKQYNITIQQLMSWNNLDFDAVKIGQKLKVKQ
jgi:LysM repeat protein